MKNCTSFKKMFSNYIDDILDENKSRLFESHISECLRCNEKLAEMRKIKKSMGSLPKIATSDSFDSVMHARLRQQIRLENNRSRSLRFSAIFENIKVPAYAVVAVMLLFFGAMLQRVYDNNSSMTKMDSPTLAVQQIPQNFDIADSGITVVTKHDTANNRIINTNYPNIDKVTSANSALLRRSKSSLLSDSALPDLRRAPTRQTNVRSTQTNTNRPRIQLAKEYIF
jgi:hypothetical protein